MEASHEIITLPRGTFKRRAPIPNHKSLSVNFTKNRLYYKPKLLSLQHESERTKRSQL